MILIVEDDSALWSLYRHSLRELDAPLVFARTGQDALDILATKTPDLIFLDMRLPLVNGRAILDYVQTTPHLTQVPVVITTSSKEYAAFAAPGSFLLKPILPRTLLATARQHLRLKT